ncbi:hypothetical protein H0H87_007819 [Tephrocybe sp. NHM501043]|nr:hypothetical protein H0H87_007819 [Tephrocybe sp. NHM501043]
MDMPPAIDPDSVPGRGPGFIPPPPNAHREAQGPTWRSAGALTSPSWAFGQHPSFSPISPYDPTPGSSWGGHSPASRGPATPGNGFINFPPAGGQSALGQPVSPSPWFNGGGVTLGGHGADFGFAGRHEGWRDEEDTGPERRRNKPWPSASPAYSEFPLERAWSNEAHGLGGRPSMRRSLSTGGVRDKRSRSRSHTSGNLQPFQPHRAIMSEDYGPDNLARRPKDWRPDYESRSLVPFIPRLGKNRLEVPEFSDATKRTIHGNLSYSPNDPHVTYDLRLHLDHGLDFPRLEYKYNYIDFAQLATNPPVDQMRLFHPLLPWYIDVVQHHQNGITIQDVLWQMHLQLNVPIISRHFYNEDLPSPNKERIYKAFIARANGDPEEINMGIKRIDFLEDKYTFVGLVRSKNGHWEMKTKNM